MVRCGLPLGQADPSRFNAQVTSERIVNSLCDVFVSGNLSRFPVDFWGELFSPDGIHFVP